MRRTTGIHHVTSVAGAAQGNVDFYTGGLGLRLVKRTVNFDDPGTWHLYYGDRSGSPGTLITFFPWQGIPVGRPGVGETAATAYAVPARSLENWADSLGVEQEPTERFGDPVLSLRDTDGSSIEIVGEDPSSGEDLSPAAEAAIRGFHSVTLAVAQPEPTARILTGILGYESIGEENGRLRFAVPGPGPGRIVDLVRPEDSVPARLGSGSVHHVAFRARDDDEQAEFRGALQEAGIDVTPVRDRQYFRSIYFREPGGVLFEIATDPPGMLIDEPLETLGTELRLPPWYESARDRIEAALPPIRTTG
jgi:glyoxalase family protein